MSTSSSPSASAKTPRHRAADHVAASDDGRVKVVHVARKATASQIRRTLGISAKAAKHAHALVQRVISQR